MASFIIQMTSLVSQSGLFPYPRLHQPFWPASSVARGPTGEASGVQAGWRGVQQG